MHYSTQKTHACKRLYLSLHVTCLFKNQSKQLNCQKMEKETWLGKLN